jgi:hypothetical protein
MILGLMMVAQPARAADISAWVGDRFPRNEAIAGNDGWIGGYDGDPWFGLEQNGESYALSASDDANEDVGAGETYGPKTPSDNWLVSGNLVGQGVTSVVMFESDDDAIGLTFSNDTNGNFYLAFYSGDSAPPPLGRVDRPGVFLLRVEKGSAEVLADGRVGRNVDVTEGVELVADINDGHIVVTVNGEQAIEVDDPSPLPPGQSGFYAYNSGSNGNDDTYAGFDVIRVDWHDDDSDAIVDDDDNCEKNANADQADADGDGLGDVCDDTPGNEGDADTDADSDSDTDADADADVDGNDVDGFLTDEPLHVGTCGCETSRVAGLAPVLLAFALGLRRRAVTRV